MSVKSLLKREGIENAEKINTLTINKGNITGLSFVNTQVTYDGTVKSLLVTGTLPDGVEVAYTGNTGTDAGTYNATATFTVTNPNYNALDAMHAKVYGLT